MSLNVGGGPDAAFLDDVVLKEGKLGKYGERIYTESPEDWWDWDPSNAEGTLTIDGDGWRAHYKRRFPLALYHDRRFVFGIEMGERAIYVDESTPDQVWARLVEEVNDGGVISEGSTMRVVLERGDYPRFQTGPVEIPLFTTPVESPDHPNVLRLGNGYSLAHSRRVSVRGQTVIPERDCWFMIGPTEDEATLSRRVLAVKVYDGPHTFQARGTDIELTDPTPVSSKAEYVIYAYDGRGLKGTYHEVFEGVKPVKRALVVSGEDLTNTSVREGLVREIDGQLAGRGRVTYRLPLRATKLLSCYARGSELDVRVSLDGGPWVDFSEYDGKAVSDLEVEVNIFDSLSSVRVEWEAISEWEPVGRPVVDILPVREAADETNRNKIRISGEKGEGIGQVIDLYTGMHTASANVRATRGRAQLVVGAHEIVNWHPEVIDKTTRGFGEFAVNTGSYDVILTGEEPEGGGLFSFEIDRIRIIDGTRPEWLPGDLYWFVETEDREIDATESVNRPNVPVSTGETNRFRIGVEAPKNLGTESVQLSAIYADLHRTGAEYPVRYAKWRGTGPSRLHVPEESLTLSGIGDYISIDGFGATTWQQTEKHSAGDVKLTSQGGRIFFKGRDIYQPLTIENEFWRVEVGQTETRVFYEGELSAVMLGTGLPARIDHVTSEDVQLDCSDGLVQLRRGMGPRFEGFELDSTKSPTAERGAVVAFGFDDSEARDNLAFYTVFLNR